MLQNTPPGTPGVSKNPQKYFTNKSDELLSKKLSKFEIKLKNLKNRSKMTVFPVYTLIRAKPFSDIDVTNAHNPSDQETVEFLSRNYQV